MNLLPSQSYYLYIVVQNYNNSGFSEGKKKAK